MSDSYEHLPLARVESESSFSLIWVIPIVALFVGGWLMYKVYTERGDIITITFQNAEGIEVKKTAVRYKDVTVGKVLSINLDHSLDNVLVEVEIIPSMAKHLGPKTQFWTVRPRVSVKGISGLTTLLSGIYIGMDPGEEGDALSVYEGLQTPPLITPSTEGSVFSIQANRLGSLDVGSPVYYRQINVGEIIEYKLNEDNDTIQIIAFINDPHDQLVRRNSIFWNVSGFDLELSPTGDVKVRVESLISLLIGGITFETPQTLTPSLPVTTDTFFPLYSSEDDAKIGNTGENLTYVMYFAESLRGLTIGAPVEYRGMQIGKIEDIQLTVEEFNNELKIPVIISIFADKLSLDGDIDDARDVVENLVNKGIRGQLTTSSLLTGTQFISMVFPENAPSVPGIIKVSSDDSLLDIDELPTTDGMTTMLTKSVTSIIADIQGGIKDARSLISSPEIKASTKDISAILDNIRSLLSELKPELVASMKGLRRTLRNAEAISGKLNKQTLPLANQLNNTLRRLDGALIEAKKTLSSADTMLNEDSSLQYELRLLIEEVSEAANSFTILANTLQRKPDSVIFGK